MMMAKKDNEFQEYLDHFPKGIGKNIERYVSEEVFEFRRYIFTRRKGEQQYGYCTYCQKEFKTNGLKHNEETQCPMCKSLCNVKSSGISRSRLVNEAYFVYYEKSIKNPSIIIARGFLAVRDFRNDYIKVKTQYLVTSFYVFEMGNSVMLKRYGYYSDAGTMQVYGMHRCSTVHSLPIVSPRVIVAHSHDSIREAVKDTPFRYSTWESYDAGDMVKFFDLYSKYPCIEYLTKLGLKNLVEPKLTGGNTYSSINWRATSLLSVLKLSKGDLAEIKASNIHIDTLSLRLFQISKKDGSNLSFAEVTEIKETYLNFNYLQKALKWVTLRQIRNYIDRQQRVTKGHSKNQILSTWNDYFADCITLDMNLTDERILFPKDLFKAHQETSKQIKSEENKLMDAKIQARLADLSYYCFQYRDLMIRPAFSTKELIDEGKALTICIGNYQNGYMSRYSRGEIVLLLIRRISEPDKPFYAMELKKNIIIQTQGEKHCLPTKEVSEFIEAFEAEKLKEKKPKSRIKIPA